MELFTATETIVSMGSNLMNSKKVEPLVEPHSSEVVQLHLHSSTTSDP